MYQVDNIVRIYLNAKCVSLIAEISITYNENKLLNIMLIPGYLAFVSTDETSPHISLFKNR